MLEKPSTLSHFKLPRKIRFLAEIYTCCPKDYLIDTDVERILGFYKPQPDLREVLNILRKKGILDKEKLIRGNRYYKINFKKLKRLIHDTEFYKYNAKIIVKDNAFWEIHVGVEV